MEKRDYLETYDSLSNVISSSFWEEEICYVLDGRREVQVKFQGGITEYFKDLIKKTPNPNFQKYLFSKALINTLKNINIDDILYNFNETVYYENLVSLINLTRTFCNRNNYAVQFFIEIAIKLQKRIFKKNGLIDLKTLKSYNKIINLITFLVEDFIPIGVSYPKLVNDTFPELSFLLYWFNKIKELIMYNGIVNITILIHFIKYAYPLSLKSEILESIVNNEESIDAIFTEFSINSKQFEELVINIINHYDNKNLLLRKLNDFGIPKNIIESVFYPESYSININKQEFNQFDSWHKRLEANIIESSTTIYTSIQKYSKAS